MGNQGRARYPLQLPGLLPGTYFHFGLESLRGGALPLTFGFPYIKRYMYIYIYVYVEKGSMLKRKRKGKSSLYGSSTSDVP